MPHPTRAELRQKQGRAKSKGEVTFCPLSCVWIPLEGPFPWPLVHLTALHLLPPCGWSKCAHVVIFCSELQENRPCKFWILRFHPFPAGLLMVNSCTSNTARRKPRPQARFTACKRADECLPHAVILSLPSYTHHQHAHISIHTPPPPVGPWWAFHLCPLLFTACTPCKPLLAVIGETCPIGGDNFA